MPCHRAANRLPYVQSNPDSETVLSWDGAGPDSGVRLTWRRRWSSLSTAYATSAHVARYTTLGFVARLAKPFSEARVLRRERRLTAGDGAR